MQLPFFLIPNNNLIPLTSSLKRYSSTISSEKSSGCISCNGLSTDFYHTQCVTPCPVGSYSSTGNSPCTLCNPGTYNNYTGQIYCLPCSNGTYQPQYGQTTCQPCGGPNMSTSPSLGASSLSQCYDPRLTTRY